eukprot:CAMPEP_0201486218 /NCGR_PEP_ID=MMETSP0151_2-20130828/10286_1 /ASSEMBLY_ACC=CAM_ASM_000257 /TAXON_ID=200890 /ORGANISM="Paramoeba atlantica, Strain 621/1 / CCAP 1560/9" /LENGTH=504 /DNA_ID=CAMNT_0047870735 /DNA_START=123 /DNA_END=1634 /DNA_ORIENTATION=-
MSMLRRLIPPLLRLKKTSFPGCSAGVKTEKASENALRSGARIYLNFLSLAHQIGFTKQTTPTSLSTPLSRIKLIPKKEEIENSVRKYIEFSNLREKRPEWNGQEITHILAPSLAVNVVWCVDLLRPLLYSRGLGKVEEKVEREWNGLEEKLNKAALSNPWYFQQSLRYLHSGGEKGFEKETRRNLSRTVLFVIVSGFFFSFAPFPFCFVVPPFLWYSAFLSKDKGILIGNNDAVSVFESENHSFPGFISNESARNCFKLWKKHKEATELKLKNQTNPSRDKDKEKELVDLVIAHSNFQSKILSLGPNVVTPTWIDRAINRYFKFLYLFREVVERASQEERRGEWGEGRKKQRPVLVPTLDIDLIWHVHMLSGLDYRDDCATLFGQMFNHTANVSCGGGEKEKKEEERENFRVTRELWREVFDEEYEINLFSSTAEEKEVVHRDGDGAGGVRSSSSVGGGGGVFGGGGGIGVLGALGARVGASGALWGTGSKEGQHEEDSSFWEG